MKNQEDTNMNERNYSGEIATMIGAFLKTDDWNYRFNKETGRFRFGLNTGNKLKTLDYLVGVDTDAYTVYAVSPIGADISNPEERAAMAEFICRANYGMRYGNFEMDLRDGEIRYKCFVNCDGALPSPAIVKDSIYMPAVTFSHYTPGILAILYTGASAEEAMALCGEEA